MPTYTRRGEFNRRLLLERATPTQDPDTGDPVIDWSEIDTVWGAAEPGRGSEFYANSGIVAAKPMLFRFGYRSDVDATIRVTYRGEIYSVDSVQDYRDSRTETWIYARAGVNLG